jgi:plastocyanin
MRVIRPVGVILICGLALAPAAGAATQQVQAQDNFFSPRTVTINPGDTVQWSQSGLLPHNVKFDDGSFEQPADPQSTPWTASRTFSTPGSFRYYCRQHGSPGGGGMAGTVVVAGAGGTTPGGGTTPTGDRVRPGIRALNATQSGRNISVSLNTSEAGRATVVVQRNVTSSRLRQVARVTKSVPAGRSKIAIRRTSRGRRLPFARYKLTVTVKDRAGNVSSKRTDRVRLRARRR